MAVLSYGTRGGVGVILLVDPYFCDARCGKALCPFAQKNVNTSQLCIFGMSRSSLGIWCKLNSAIFFGR